MAAPVNPSFGAKASLVTGRALQSAFDTPAKMTVAAGTTGATTHAFLASINASAKDSYAALQPRGPAKWLEGLFAKVDKATAQSVEQADKATKLFWVPFSEGSHRTGNAAAFPFAARYADKVGIEIPKEPAAADKLLAELLAAKGFPVPAPKDEGGEPPAPDKPGEGGGEPVPPAKPGESEPTKPGEPDAPAEPTKPGEGDPAKPAEPDAPAEPGKPGEGDPSKPAEPDAPAEPGKPEGDGAPTPAPAEPTNPGEASAATQPQSAPPADAAPAESPAPASAPAGPAPTGPAPTA